MKETYAESAQVSRSDWFGSRGGDRLVRSDGPFQPFRFDAEVERTRILVDVHRIATDTPMVDRQDQGTPADIAVDGDLKDSLPGGRLVSGFPLQAQRAGVADERFRGYWTVAGPGSELPPGLYISCLGLRFAAAPLEKEAQGCCHKELVAQ